MKKTPAKKSVPKKKASSKKGSKAKVTPKPRKSADLFVTKGQLDAVESSLRKEITSLRLEMKAGFTSIEAKFVSMEAKLAQMLALMEEQRAQNRFVLDGYTSLHDEQKGINTRVGNLEKAVLGKEQI